MFGSLRKKLNDAWSQADVWDKKENQQQRQVAQTRRQAQPTPPVQTRRNSLVGKNDNQPGFQITNNSLTRGLSRGFDQVNMFDNNRTWQQRTPTGTQSIGQEAKRIANTPTTPKKYFDSGVGKAVNTAIAGTNRAAAGIGQEVSGFVDLVTPGKGNSRVTSYFKDRGAMWDEKAKEAGVDGLGYKASQVPLNVASYMVPGAVAKGVGSIPKVATASAKVANIANKTPLVSNAINAGAKLSSKLDDIAKTGNIAQRTGAKLASSYMSKPAIADVGFDAVQSAGSRTSKGQDNSIGTLAVDTGLSLATQGAVNVAGQAIKPVTTRLVQGVKNLPSPRQVTTRLVNAGQKMDEALFTPRLNRLDLDTRDALIAYSDRLVGADPYITGKVESDLIKKVRAIGDANGVDLTNGTVVQQLDRIEALLNGYKSTSGSLNSKPVPVDPLESLKQEARKYKSADEFVKANYVAHGTPNKIEGNIRPSSGWYGKATYLTDDITGASGRGGGQNIYFVEKPKGKLLDIKAHGSKDNTSFTPKQYQDAIDNGYDGLRIKHDNGKTWYAMFKEQPAKTKQQLTDLYNQATQSQPPKSTPVQKVAKADHWTTPLPDDGKRPPITAKDTNGVIPKEGDVIEFPGALGGKGRTTVHWQGPVRANASGKEIPGQWIGNGVLREDSPIPFTVVERNGKPLAPKVEVPTGFSKSLEDAGFKPTSSGVQKARSSAPTELSASKSKTSVDQPQVAEMSQSVKQGNAKGKVKQASQTKEAGISTDLSEGKMTKARSQKATATELQSPETKLSKKEMQELSSTYPDNTTDVVNKRGFTKSVKSSGEVSPVTQKAVSGEYNVRSTKKLAITADEFSKGDIGKVTKEVNSRLDVPTGKINDQDIADSIAVAKRLDSKGDYEQATQIYDKLAEHGTKGGQAIQAFSLLKNRTPDGLRFQAVKQLKKAGVKLTGDEEKQLGNLIDAVRKSKGEAKDKAIFDTFDFVSRKLPTSTGDKIINFWRAGLLTAPRTTGGNILGNLTEASTRELWTNPVAVTTDRFFSLFTGKRTKTLAGGRLKGVKEGVQKGAEYLKTGYDPRNVPNMKYDAPRRVNYNNKIVDTYVNGVYRWMGGQDQPFYYAAKSAAAYDLAKADGINLKLKGKDLGEYIDKAISDENWKPQTFKTAKDATDYGKYAVYQNETVLGNMASGLKKSAGKARPVADFLMPFTQVPSSVAMRIVDRTPIGVAKEVVSQIKNKSFDQRAMSEAIANGSFGVPVLAAGYALAQSGMITGAYPQDSKERKLWDAEGKQPYSVKVGDRWYSLNYMQPFGTVLSMGKQVADDKLEGKSDTESWMNAVATAAKSVENQSFLQGINGALSAVNDPQRSMKQYVNSTASGVVPNFVRSGATASDPYQREVKDAKEAFISGVPGARQKLNTKLDMFGNDLPARDNFLNQYFNPLRPSKVRDTDDITKELRRLQDADNGIVPTEFNKKSIGGVELNRDQIRKLNQQTNSAVQVVWGNVVQDPRYKQMEDGDKKRTLEKIKEVIAENSKLKFITDNGIKSTTEYKEKGLDLEKLLNGKSDKVTKKTKSKGKGRGSRGGRKGGSKAGYNYAKALFDANVGAVSMTKDLQSILEKYMKAAPKNSKKA